MLNPIDLFCRRSGSDRGSRAFSSSQVETPPGAGPFRLGQHVPRLAEENSVRTPVHFFSPSTSLFGARPGWFPTASAILFLFGSSIAEDHDPLAGEFRVFIPLGCPERRPGAAIQTQIGLFPPRRFSLNRLPSNSTIFWPTFPHQSCPGTSRFT